MVRAGNAEFGTGHWRPADSRARRGAYLGHGDGAYVMNTRLLLIRHGETTSNVSGELDTGAPGAQLTTLGRRQASGAATALAGEAFGSVHVSRLVRTQQTAEPIVGARNIVCPLLLGLEELLCGNSGMRSDIHAVKRYHSTVSPWVHGALVAAMPGGETGHGFLKRYNNALEHVIAESRDVSRGGQVAVAVSHGAAIRTWVANQIPGGYSTPVVTELLHNTGCVTLEGNPHEGWRLVEWHSEPIGGRYLEDLGAADPTRKPVDE